MSVRVFILTTEGPVEVQRITAEDPGVQSVICLDGKAVSLPVSPAYEAFVRSPTGVIEANFGHSAYRLDVSERISEGLSWQLGVFLAHALYRLDRLACGTGEIAVLTTGEVDRDLNVLAVEDVPEKLLKAEALISELARSGTDTRILLPRENMPTQSSAVSIVPLSTIAEAFAVLEMVVPMASPPAYMEGSRSRPRGRNKSISALILGLVAVFAVIFWSIRVGNENGSIETAKRIAAPLPVPDLATTVFETRAPKGKTCAAVHFNAAKPKIFETTISKGGQFADSKLKNLCGLDYRVTNRGPPVILSVLGVRGARGDETLRPKLFFRRHRLGAGEQASLSVQPPRTTVPVRLRFLLIAEPDLESASQLPESVDPLPDTLSRARLRELMTDISDAGLTVFTLSHILVPEG